MTLPSNWYDNSSCKGCVYGEHVTSGVFCNEIQGLVPVGYQGCKAEHDYYDEMYKRENGMTLTELAKKLRKIFRFKYLTVEIAIYNPYFCLWTERPYWNGKYWGAKEDGQKHLVTDFLDFEIVESIDLSEYKEENGEIDYSRCIVEVE